MDLEEKPRKNRSESKESLQEGKECPMVDNGKSVSVFSPQYLWNVTQACHLQFRPCERSVRKTCIWLWAQHLSMRFKYKRATFPLLIWKKHAHMEADAHPKSRVDPTGCHSTQVPLDSMPLSPLPPNQISAALCTSSSPGPQDLILNPHLVVL